MQLSDFHYVLPPELIAKQPAKERTAGRLLSLDGVSGSLRDGQFSEILDCVESGDLMVFNNTRVIPARVFGQKATGGKVELLIERVLSEHQALTHIRASKAPKAGSKLLLEGGPEVNVVGRDDALFIVEFPVGAPVIDTLERIGHMPLPPYIDRADEDSDKERYQTVYSQHKGAVAAPTAGLHFDEEMLAALAEKGVKTAFVTLHVGAGTFQPVRVSNIKEHKMHAEYMVVDQAVCDAVNETKAAGKRVIAVGTTSVRSLESAAASGDIRPVQGDTDIFIYPGYQFNVVDVLITNFHLPESTLLMLISAFAGYKHVMKAYEHAVAKAYRFFSYGDAMWITRNPKAADQGPK